MFSLIMGFWKMLFKKSEYQVLIVGIDYAGKTVCGHAVPNADVRAHASPVGVLAHAVLSECARADQEHIQRPRAPPARQDSSHRRPQYWARAHRALKSSLLGPGWRAELTLAVGEVRDAHYGSAHYRCTRPPRRRRPPCSTFVLPVRPRHHLRCRELDSLPCVWRALRYYSEAHALLYVVDSADESRLEESRSASPVAPQPSTPSQLTSGLEQSR